MKAIQALNQITTQPDYPSQLMMEGVCLTAFTSKTHLFKTILTQINHKNPGKVGYLNIHVANLALINTNLKSYLQTASTVYMDGAGIQLGAKILGYHLPERLTAADWLPELLNELHQNNKSVYLLGGKPHITEKMLDVLKDTVGHHEMIAGHHHGYILDKAELEQHVIDDINAKQPDVLIVGMGSPIQESWILKHQDKLNVGLFLPLGAVMDYYTGEQSRCPDWMGNAGLEWLYRLYSDPVRLFNRYVIGNPSYLGRMMMQRLEYHLRG